MKFLKKFKIYEAELEEPDIKPNTKPLLPPAPIKPMKPTKPVPPPNFDPDYDPDGDEIPRPLVTPPPQAGEKALLKVIKRFFKENES